MLNLKRSKPQETPFASAPGIYRSRISDVHWDEKMPEGSTFVIEYVLLDETGKKYRFRESFRNNDKNQRTQDFFEYVVSAGYEDLEELSGVEEEIELQHVQSSNGNIYLNIVARRVLSNV